MNSHGDLGPELRALAQALLDRLDPAVRAAATAMAGESLRGPSRCQQVWCPVCALAALVTGEQHPLLTVIAEHSVTLMGMVKAMADGTAAPAPDAGRGADSGPADDAAPNGHPANGHARYQHIPIVVEPVTGDHPIL